MSKNLDETGQAIAHRYGLELAPGTSALIAKLEEKPGSVPSPVFAPRGSTPLALTYKVMGKMFAVLSIRGEEGVIVKCDPDKILMLKELYGGVGHRSHLDKRYWINVRLDADVPSEEVEKLIDDSYELICSSLTRKQKTELEGLSS